LANTIRKLLQDRQLRIAFLEGNGEAGTERIADWGQSLALQKFVVQRINLNRNSLLSIDNAPDLLIIPKPTQPFSEQDKFEIDHSVLILDINLTKIYSKQIAEKLYSKVSPYPTVDWDLAFLVDKAVDAGKILNDIENIAGKYLSNLTLFDVYDGKNIEAGKKSLAFNIKFSAKDRTLTDQDINPIIDKIIKMLKDKYDGQLRDS